MTSSQSLADKEIPAFRAEGDSDNDAGKWRSIDDMPEVDLALQSARQARDASAGDEHEQLRRKYLLFRFWRTATGFWSRTRGDRLAWVLTGRSFCPDLCQSGRAVRHQSVESQDFRRARTARQRRPCCSCRWCSFRWRRPVSPFGVTNVWARMTTQRRWRAWVSDSVISRWLKNGRYYQLNLVSGDHQNPGGRLTDDLRVSTDAPVDFAVGVVQAALSALTFIAVLWTIGGALTIPIGGVSVTIPGFLVIAAITLRRAGQRRDGVRRQKIRVRLGSEKPGRSDLSLSTDARARIWRKHRAARRRSGGARRHRPFAGFGAAALARALPPAHEDDGGVARLAHAGGGDPDHSVRAEIPRRHDVARSGHAGGLRLHHRAKRVLLAGR